MPRILECNSARLSIVEVDANSLNPYLLIDSKFIIGNIVPNIPTELLEFAIRESGLDMWMKFLISKSLTPKFSEIL